MVTLFLNKKEKIYMPANCNTCGSGFTRCLYDLNCNADFIQNVFQSVGFNSQCTIQASNVSYFGIPYLKLADGTPVPGRWSRHEGNGNYVIINSRCINGTWTAFLGTSRQNQGQPGEYDYNKNLMEINNPMPAQCIMVPHSYLSETLQDNCEGYHHQHYTFYNPEKTMYILVDTKITVNNNPCKVRNQ